MKKFTKEEFKVLKFARETIAKEEHWCQGWFVRDRKGAKVHLMSPNAYKYCASGAIMRAVSVLKLSNVSHWEIVEKLRKRIKDKKLFRHMSLFNDAHTHAEVIKLFDDAIGEEKNA
jgi:hypothetical protein